MFNMGLMTWTVLMRPLLGSLTALEGNKIAGGHVAMFPVYTSVDASPVR